MSAVIKKRLYITICGASQPEIPKSQLIKWPLWYICSKIDNPPQDAARVKYDIWLMLNNLLIDFLCYLVLKNV